MIIKRIIVLYFLFLFYFSSEINAQNDTKIDTTYYNNNYHQIYSISIIKENTTQIKKYYRSGIQKSINNYLNNTQNGEQFYWFENGILNKVLVYKYGQIISEKVWYENGVLNLEHHFLFEENYSFNSKNKYHGSFIENYQSGFKKIVGYYDSGLKINTWTEYYESGKLKLKVEYKYGIYGGVVQNWYPNGQTKSIKKFKIIENKLKTRYYNNYENEEISKNQKWISVLDGKSIRYFENGKMSFYGNYKNGQKNGDFKTWGNNGMLQTYIQYKKGLIYGKNNKYFYDGKPEEIKNQYSENTQNTYYNGKYEKYYSNGNLKVSILYKNKKKEGPYIENYENGSSKLRAKYHQDKLVDEYIIFNEQGDTMSFMKYLINENKNSVLDGPYLYKDRNGSKTKGNYIKGKQEGLWQKWNNNQLISEEYFCSGLNCGIKKRWDGNGYLTEEIYSSTTNKKIKKTVYKNKQINTLEFYDKDGQTFKNMNFENNQINSIKYFFGGSYKGYESKRMVRIIQFFHNGNIKLDLHQLDGIKVGVSFKYYFNGKPMQIENFSNHLDQNNNFSITWDPAGKMIDFKNYGDSKNMIKIENELYQLALRNNINQNKFKIDSSIENFSTYIKLEKNGENLNYLLNYWNEKPCIIYQFKNIKANGIFQYWSNNGVLIQNGNCKEGNKNGLWTENNLNNQKISETIYSNDTLWCKEFYENQQVKEIYSKFKFHKFGENIFYYENGQKSEFYNYKNGQLEGKYNSWYSNGQLKNESNYSEGELNGQYTEYYENGKIQKKGLYLKSRQNGTWDYFDEDGNQLAIIDFQNEKHSLFINDICQCQKNKIEIPQNLTPIESVLENNFIKMYRSYIYKNSNYNDLIKIYNFKSSKNELSEQISFTAFYNDIFFTNYNNYGLFYNPCFHPKNRLSSVNFEINKINNKREFKAILDNIGFRFSNYLITPSDKKYKIIPIKYFSDLKFNISSLKFSNDSLIFENPNNFCMVKSNIYNSKIHFTMDSIQIKYNNSYKIIQNFDSTNSYHYFNKFIYSHYYSYSNLFFESNKTKFFLPLKSIDSSKNEDEYFETNGQLVLSDTKLLGQINFKSTQINDSTFNLNINNKSYKVNINQFIKFLFIYKDNRGSHFEYYYLPKTQELTLLIYKNS